MPNIKEVASKAGVSPSTVSRVLNKSKSVSEETRGHILSVMREQNYIPNSMARGLSNNRGYSVALLINVDNSKAFFNPFFNEVIHGIETVLYNNELSLIIANQQTKGDYDRLDWIIKGKRAQGVILPSNLLYPVLVKKLQKEQFPFVAIGEPEGIFDAIDWVDINNQQGAQQAVLHLREQQYQKIAFLCGSLKEVFNRNRLLGYKSLVEEPAQLICEGAITKEDGFMMLKRLLASDKPPDAVICSDNILALGSLKAAQQVGLRIPQDFGVLSFDNYPIADLLEPTITTIDVDVFELGKQAANILLQMIENPSSSRQACLISTSVQVRESTKRY
ncbi:MAG: LacI family transcriptional regulator [Treponema sp.]|nr:LacI family transcriptional regulator [Treponema sp.]